MLSLDRYAEDKLDALERRALRRTLADTAREETPFVTRGGRRLLSFSCNDYLGLSRHPAVKAAAIAAVERYGAGAGASRLVTGNHPPLVALEAKLAAMKGTEAACVFGSGYLANIGVLGVLAGPDDLIVIDALAHACLFAGARLSEAHTLVFAHNDVDAAAALIAAHRNAHRHALIVTETVFSMDGDRAPVAALAALAGAHDAWLLSDDAHGFGLDGGDAPSHVPLRMGTLSKAIGGYGGYLAASAPVVALMRTRARSFVYSTGLPPASAAAALAALDIIDADPALRAEPLRKARRFTRALNLPDAESAIVPLVLGDPEAALAASAVLERAGFLVTAIRPPTVPDGTARLRFAFCALHEDSDIDRLAATVREEVLREPCPASS
ncbi:8-amino-7-oxononanoate synthase [Beijerinckiaceae bacterium RH AL1]|nr:aminotransferase class I/II-fold pyridoxal phosphate-dependent enzyme [Beijerinckiaceae bacterium]VVB46020.1 8-amino-7-oxononanoate synthase [Beijerinckiaceae bacterium RH CH11]VVB46100.1 8-amino-7-oxononanoate synthase [Beijerinckiaceae bacterium RH AL8]VVC55161.1 8-amino-7-oxononanoate synthase [Beijerinckiaceae bacterium RH AL1]